MKKNLLLTAVWVYCLSFTCAQSGILDRSFGKNGVVKTAIGSEYPYYITSYQVLLQSDTAIYALINSYPFSIITKRHSDGSADSSYGENGFSVPVRVEGSHTLAIQQDGKILVAGNTSKETNDFAVARYNTDGSLDGTFGVAGRQTTDFDSGDDYGSSVAVQSDGKIVVGGNTKGANGTYYALARYNSDGSLDTGFGLNGKKVHGFGINGDGNGSAQQSICNSIAIQQDQKVVAAGYTSDGYKNYFAVARYNADGSLDSTFSGDGRKTTDFGGGAIANSVAIQKDGRIVLTGTVYPENFRSDFAVARYTAKGNLDRSFSYDGKQTVNLTHHDVSYTVAIQPDEKIVCVGYSDLGASYSSIAVARLDTNGSIDKTFDNNVRNTVTFTLTDNHVAAVSLAVRKDGKIIVVGYDEGDLLLFRLNNEGTRDTTFASNGILKDNLHQKNSAFVAVAVQKDGKIVAAGNVYSKGKFVFAVVRYNTNGSLDSTFGDAGTQITHFTFYEGYVGSIAIQSDGKIVVAGTVRGAGNRFFGVVRYNANGGLDSSFNGNGMVMTNLGKKQSDAHSVAIQSDGKIVVGGSAVTGSTADFAIVRYNTDGSLDKSFAVDGKKTTDFANNADVINSIAIDANGKIVAAGQAFTNNTNFAIARYNSNGDLDQTFGNGGKITTPTGEGNSAANSVAIQGDGKIVTAGYSFTEGNYCFTLVRYNTDGNPDTAFSGDGKQFTHFGSYAASANTIAIQNDGKLIAGGYFNTDNSYYSNNSALARYNTDGTLDSSFANNGKQTATVSPGFNSINSIAIAGNKLYAAGLETYPATSGIVTKYLLDNSNTPPTVSITTPADKTAYLAPAAHIKLGAAAADSDGNITKVEFYNGSTLLHTETVIPFGYVWRNVSAGNYTLTAKAYDNTGNVTTSAAVHIFIVANKRPAVRIISPANNQTYADSATIHLIAAAADTDGRIAKVEFYNGTALLRTEYKYPYTYNWTNVSAGTYTITAVATDNWGAHTTSDPVIVKVTSDKLIVGSQFSWRNEKAASNDALSLRLSPNPASNTVNIYTNGLQANKPATLSIISTAGIVLKTMQISNSATHLDVSSLISGVYTIKVVSGEKVVYKQFVKL